MKVMGWTNLSIIVLTVCCVFLVLLASKYSLVNRVQCSDLQSENQKLERENVCLSVNLARIKKENFILQLVLTEEQKIQLVRRRKESPFGSEDP